MLTPTGKYEESHELKIKWPKVLGGYYLLFTHVSGEMTHKSQIMSGKHTYAYIYSSDELAKHSANKRQPSSELNERLNPSCCD